MCSRYVKLRYVVFKIDFWKSRFFAYQIPLTTSCFLQKSDVKFYLYLISNFKNSHQSSYVELSKFFLFFLIVFLIWVFFISPSLKSVRKRSFNFFSVLSSELSDEFYLLPSETLCMVHRSVQSLILKFSAHLF